MTTKESVNIVRVKRVIKSPRERVFDAWVSPNKIHHWFGPAACRVVEAKVDLRVGGAFSIRVFAEEMGEMTVTGEYREVNPPEKLVFTWGFEDDADWENVASLVTVEFLEAEAGTEVRITHEGFPSSDSASNHERGWTGSLDKLEVRALVLADLMAAGRVGWNELMCEDVEGAAKFYTSLFGWEAAPMEGGMPYTIFKQNGTEVGGLLKPTRPGAPTQWLPYIMVQAADASAKRVAELGGTVCAEPFDIPGVGRIAVARDPQGAVFGVFEPDCS